MVKWITTLSIIVATVMAETPQYLFPNEASETAIAQWELSSDSSFQSDRCEIGQTEPIFRNQSNRTIQWYRTTLFLPEPLPPHEMLTISVPVLLTAYELFWDGTKIGSNGTIQTDSTGLSGRSGRYFHLPPQLCTTGEHILTIRVLNTSPYRGSLTHPVTIGRSESLRQKHLRQFGTSLVLAGIFLVTGIFHLFMVSNKNRKLSHIIFSLFSLSCAGHLGVQSTIVWGSVPLDSLLPFIVAGDLFWFGMVALLPIYLLYHFSAYKRVMTSILILIISSLVVLLPRLALLNILPADLVPVLHNLNLFYAYLSATAAAAVALGATIRKRKGSRTILSGMCLFIAGMTVSTLFNTENGWSVGFALLNIFITIAISRQFSAERQLYYKSELRASRLELELLKEHLQPHFLLNSLNSIVAWIEEEPAVAAKLVNALSQELRLLLAYAGERTINLSQEIKICRIHLEVMNMRQEKNYRLELFGEREGILIPPFIIHTLIENGISHGFRKKDTGLFTLTVSRTGNRIEFRLWNNGDNRARTAAGEGKGTGTRYIRSRLQELYGTDYCFISRSTDDGWESIIIIPGELQR